MRVLKIIRRLPRIYPTLIIPVVGIGVGVALSRRQHLAQLEAASVAKTVDTRGARPHTIAQRRS
jgi:hypothetical protein